MLHIVDLNIFDVTIAFCMKLLNKIEVYKKYWVFSDIRTRSKRLFKIFIICFPLFFIFYFLPFNMKAYAGYPTLRHNDLIDEVDSGDWQGKTNQDNNEKETKKAYTLKGFHISTSLGFNESFYVDPYGSFDEEGFVWQLILDYWFNNVIGLGMAGGFHYLDGGYGGNPPGTKETNFFAYPYIKLGLPIGSKWSIFFNLGIGLYVANYLLTRPSNLVTEVRYSYNLGLGGSIRINRHFETGLIFDYKKMRVLLNGQVERCRFHSLTVSSFLGYVF